MVVKSKPKSKHTSFLLNLRQWKEKMKIQRTFKIQTKKLNLKKKIIIKMPRILPWIQQKTVVQNYMKWMGRNTTSPWKMQLRLSAKSAGLCNSNILLSIRNIVIFCRKEITMSKMIDHLRVTHKTTIMGKLLLIRCHLNRYD